MKIRVQRGSTILILLFAFRLWEVNLRAVDFLLSSSPAVGNGPQNITAVDVNSDGKLDLVSVNYFDTNLTVLTNNGNGTMNLSATYPVGWTPEFVLGIDVNEDHKPDLISANVLDSTLTMLTNTGDGTFALSGVVPVETGTGPNWIVALDVNDDGKIDLITANTAADSITVLTNKGASLFETRNTIAVGRGPICISKGDFNSDGKSDLVTADCGIL